VSVSVWRIAQDTKDYEADDLTGKGAETTGGRWNDKGTPLLYTSSNRALACLETIVHLNAGGLPLNRYLIEVLIPDEVWSATQIITEKMAPVGWDAEPESKTSSDYGNKWVKDNATLLLSVPSVIVPDEANILINPRHPDMAKVTARKVRKWLYDPRLIRKA
jgi:RES domain-containing protein